MADNDGDSDEARTLRALQAAACTYRIAFGPRVRLQARLIEKKAREHAMHDLQHGRYQLRLRGQQQAKRNRQPHDPNEHPLAHRHMGDDVVHQVRSGLCHAAGAARRAKAAPLAAEGDQFVVAAVNAAQPQEAVGQDAALEEGAELVLHELRQIGPGGGFGLGEEGRGVLLHQTVPRGLLGVVTLVVDRGAVARPPGLPADGLHALLPRLCPRTVSSRAQRRNRPEGRLPLGAYLRVPISEVLPLTHFLRIVRGIMLKGNDLVQVLPELWPMLAFLLGAGALALARYRRTLD